MFDREWIPATAELDTATIAAQLVARLMQHEPGPSGGTLDHPTPTPSQWAAITAAASKALIALHWHRHHAQDLQQPEVSGALRALLRKVSQDLLVGRLLDPKLDVQQVLRYMLFLQQ